MRVVEVCPVIHRGLRGRGSTEDFGPPGIEVGVEVDDADGAVGFGDGAEEGQCDGVVSAEGYDAWEGLFVFGGADLVRIRGWCAHEEAVVPFFDLLDCVGIVVAGMCQLVGSIWGGLTGVYMETYDVTGTSPQSSTVAQLLNGLASRGTL